MATREWGIFSDDSVDWTAEESVESGFYSRSEAEIRQEYGDDDDDLIVHECEETETEDNEEDQEECEE